MKIIHVVTNWNEILYKLNHLLLRVSFKKITCKYIDKLLSCEMYGLLFLMSFTAKNTSKNIFKEEFNCDKYMD